VCAVEIDAGLRWTERKNEGTTAQR
jgi:hypothetical protein